MNKNAYNIPYMIFFDFRLEKSKIYALKRKHGNSGKIKELYAFLFIIRQKIQTANVSGKSIIKVVCCLQRMTLK